MNITLPYKTVFRTVLIILFIFHIPAAGSGKKINFREALTGGNKQNFLQAVNIIKQKRPAEMVPLITNMIIKNRYPEKRDLLLETLKSYNRNSVLDSWLEILGKTDSIEIKSDIIGLLKGLDNRKITASLTLLLDSRYTTIRKKAAEALKKFSDDRMYLYILRLAESDNPLRRLYAVDALMQLYDKRLYPTLLELLKDRNKSVRIYSLRCILANRLTEALPFVRKTAASDSNSEVIIEAIRTIRGLFDRKAHYFLNRLVSHSDERVRKESIITLRELNLKSSAVLLSLQLQKEKNDSISGEIIDTLIRFRNSGNAKGLHTMALSHKNIRLRIKAIFAIGKINSEREINTLFEALKDPDYRVRAESCHSLGMFRSRLVLIPLLNHLKKEKVRYVKTAALYSINAFNDRRSLLPLFRLYTVEEDPVFRDILEGIISRNIEKFI